MMCGFLKNVSQPVCSKLYGFSGWLSSGAGMTCYGVLVCATRTHTNLNASPQASDPVALVSKKPVSLASLFREVAASRIPSCVSSALCNGNRHAAMVYSARAQAARDAGRLCL